MHGMTQWPILYMYNCCSPRHHETRTITFEKSCEPVGFKIQGGPAGGIFVSAVNDSSLASQAGLVIGDQLLEVNSVVMYTKFWLFFLMNTGTVNSWVEEVWRCFVFSNAVGPFPLFVRTPRLLFPHPLNCAINFEDLEEVAPLGKGIEKEQRKIIS